MRYYMIDSENVGPEWTYLMEQMSSKNRIIIFYTKNSATQSWRDIDIPSGKEFIIKRILCHEGKNALDFQLVSYLGHIIKKKDVFTIVSRDKGYDSICEFWRERGYNVNRDSMLERIKSKKIKTIVGGHSDKNGDYLKEILRKSKMKEKKEVKNFVYSELIRYYGLEDGLKIYKIIKQKIA